jgi:hypothetical protein
MTNKIYDLWVSPGGNKYMVCEVLKSGDGDLLLFLGQVRAIPLKYLLRGNWKKVPW